MHVLPFNLPLRFYFIRFIALNAPFLCDILRLSGSSAPITLIYSSFVYYFYIYSTALSPCLLMPFLAVICVNVTSTASLCMSRIKKFFSPVLVVNWVSYVFLQTSYRGAQPLFLYWTFLSLCSCFYAPWFPYLLLIFYFHLGLFLSILVSPCPHLQSIFLRRYFLWWRLIGQFGICLWCFPHLLHFPCLLDIHLALLRHIPILQCFPSLIQFQ